MIKKIYVTFGALLLGAMTIQAQSSVVAGGCDATNSSNATMGITVGQLAVETFSNDSNLVLLGIQQDYSVVESAVATKPIPDVEVKENGEAETINLAEYFITDNKLEFSSTSSDDEIAKPILDGTNLSFVIGNSGTATITVIATTKKGVETKVSFLVKVDDDDDSAIGDELTNQPIISVIGRTIYISNMNDEPCAVYDIAGKCVYSCKDMMNATITMRIVGTYVIMIGNMQQNVVVK